MTNKIIFIIGASGHGRSVLNVIQNCYPDSEQFFFDDLRAKDSNVYGVRVIGPIDSIPMVLNKYGRVGIIIAIGHNWNRNQIADRVKENCSNAEFISAIHSSAIVGDEVTIKEGTVVMPGAIIGPGSKIGEHCIVNSGVVIEHDCILENFSHIAPGAIIAGNVTIGPGSFVGLGVKIIEKITIGSNVVVGAGAVVLSNINSNILSYGTPAKDVRLRSIDEQYLH